MGPNAGNEELLPEGLSTDQVAYADKNLIGNVHGGTFILEFDWVNDEVPKAKHRYFKWDDQNNFGVPITKFFLDNQECLLIYGLTERCSTTNPYKHIRGQDDRSPRWIDLMKILGVSLVDNEFDKAIIRKAEENNEEPYFLPEERGTICDKAGKTMTNPNCKLWSNTVDERFHHLAHVRPGRSLYMGHRSLPSKFAKWENTMTIEQEPQGQAADQLEKLRREQYEWKEEHNPFATVAKIEARHHARMPRILQAID